MFKPYKMKALMLLTLLFVLNDFSIAQIPGNWDWLNHYPQNSLRTIKPIPGSNNIITAGDYGTIMISNNTGITWNVTYLEDFTYGQINDIFFLDSITGFLAGTGGKIYKTNDGGYSWQSTSTGTNQVLYKVIFYTPNNGFASGSNGVFLKTNDGGLTWHSYGFPSTENIIDFNITSGNNLYAITGNKIYFSSDEGMSWSIQQHPVSGIFRSINFIEDSIGFIVGYKIPPFGNPSDNFLLKTMNGGLDWDSTHYYGFNNKFEKVLFQSRDTGFISCERKYILKSTNGGNSWNTVFADSTFSINSIYFHSKDTGYTSLEYGYMFMTVDQGNNWFPLVDSNSTYVFNGCHFIDDSTIVVSCSNRRENSNHLLLRSTNLGLTWDSTLIKKGKGDEESIFLRFVNDTVGYYMYEGTPGSPHILLYKTSDGGINWNEINITINRSPNDLHFINENIGAFVAGREVYRTFDGGISWVLRQDSNNPTIGLMTVFTLNDSILFAGGITSAGGNPIIIKSIDGGLNWTTILLNNNFWESVIDILFVNDSIGFAITESQIFKTIDQGTNWFSVFYTGIDLNTVYFASDSVGYCIGKIGRILKTVDQGTTWFIQNSHSQHNLIPISFLNDTTGIMVGGLNSLLYTNTGGGYDCPKAVFTSSTIDGYIGDTILFGFNYSLWYLDSRTRYKFTYGDGSVDTIPYPYHIYHSDGIYEVKFYIYYLDCIDSSSVIIHVDIPTSLKNMNKSESIRIYPNPSCGILNIEYSSGKDAKFFIQNLLGQIVVQDKYRMGVPIDITSLTSGMYIIIIEDSNHIIKQKFIVDN
jgi:photosystem II stability/assembly factor-like uncharacterized protein